MSDHKLLFKTNCGGAYLRLFDSISIRLTITPTKIHLPKILMEVVHFGRDHRAVNNEVNQTAGEKEKNRDSVRKMLQDRVLQKASEATRYQDMNRLVAAASSG